MFHPCSWAYSAATAACTLSPNGSMKMKSPTVVISGAVPPTSRKGMPGLLGHRPGGQHVRGIGQADHDVDPILLDQLLGDRGDGRHVALAVLDDDLQWPPEHTAGLIDLLDRQPEPFAAGLSIEA